MGRSSNIARQRSLGVFAVVSWRLEVLSQEIYQDIRLGISPLYIIGLVGQPVALCVTHLAEALQVSSPQALQLFTSVGAGLGHRGAGPKGVSNATESRNIGLMTGRLVMRMSMVVDE